MDLKHLSQKQAHALSALLTCDTLTGAAKQSGLGTRTLFRYLRDPAFSELYRQARNEQVQQAVAQLQRMTTKAAATLDTLLSDPLTKGAVKVTAAKVILDTALRATELDSIERRDMALQSNNPKLDLSRLNDEEWHWFQKLRKKLYVPSDSGSHVGS